MQINSADRDEQFMGGIYADGYINVSDCIVNIDGYISEHGYVHSADLDFIYYIQLREVMLLILQAIQSMER